LSVVCFVMEALSVVFQVISYKLRRKRVFFNGADPSPLRLKGWKEPQIIVRFWISIIYMRRGRLEHIEASVMKRGTERQDSAGGRIGRTGRDSARFLAQQGARVLVSDLHPEAALRAEMAELQDVEIEYRLGGEEPDCLDGVDYVIPSPGVGRQKRFAARSISAADPDSKRDRISLPV
jgi:hypothetical protein